MNRTIACRAVFAGLILSIGDISVVEAATLCGYGRITYLSMKSVPADAEWDFQPEVILALEHMPSVATSPDEFAKFHGENRVVALYLEHGGDAETFRQRVDQLIKSFRQGRHIGLVGSAASHPDCATTSDKFDILECSSADACSS